MIYPFHLILSTQSRHSLPLSLIPSSTPTLSKLYSSTHSPLSLTTLSPHSLPPSHFPLSPFTYSTLSPLSLTPLASPFSPHSLGPLTMLSLLTPPPSFPHITQPSHSPDFLSALSNLHTPLYRRTLSVYPIKISQSTHLPRYHLPICPFLPLFHLKSGVREWSAEGWDTRETERKRERERERE